VKEGMAEKYAQIMHLDPKDLNLRGDVNRWAFERFRVEAAQKIAEKIPLTVNKNEYGQATIETVFFLVDEQEMKELENYKKMFLQGRFHDGKEKWPTKMKAEWIGGEGHGVRND
jgi:hypothetical protein